ncbi:MAG: penicillin acylase family protein [Promethearchaeota archaeon]
MDRIQKIAAKKMGLVGSVTVVVMVAFSVAFPGMPPLGSFLGPGGGIWDLPGEVPSHEEFTVPGLAGDVRVFRDQWGIPHIYGSNEADIAYALGYVHAQDRLFQMEMARRLTRGRLSEVVGPQALSLDEYNLAMMKEYWANQTVFKLIENAKTDPEMKKLLDILNSYVDGVNLYICRAREDPSLLPLEFKLLAFEPENWTLLDSMCFEKYMNEMLTWNYGDLYRLIHTEALGSGNFSELFGNPQPYQIPICPDYGEYSDISSPGKSPASSGGSGPTEGQDPTLDSVAGLFGSFLDGISKIPREKARLENQPLLGSNNWAVNGSKTKSGSPILCNDMHLMWSLPGIWYEAHLVDTSTGWNFYGFFLAGVPIGIVGHNQYIAWGFTNTGYDVMDFYYYDSPDPDHYTYKGTSTEYQKVEYQIPVKGQATVSFTVKLTRQGPVFTDFLDADTIPASMKDKAIAIRWIGHNITWDYKALYGYMHATNRAEFDAASDWFTAPAQNHVYADVHGNIGIRPTGEVPIRDDAGIPSWNTGNGSMPYDGSAGQGDWVGYVPFSELPHSENPEQGYLCSANQIVAGPEFLAKYTLQSNYDPGYRARRINTLLASHDSITVDDMKAFQLDVYSTMAGNFTPYLVSALDTLQGKTSLQQAAYDVVKSWNYVMDKDEAAPTIYYIWQEVFHDQTFSDDFAAAGDDLSYYPSDAVLEKLTKTDPNSKWFDKLSTSAVEDRDDIIISAFDTAIQALATYFGTDNASAWKWGKIHRRYFPHLTGIGSLSAGPYPSDGCGTTVNPSFGTNWDRETQSVKLLDSGGGASERMIVDFADLNNCVSVIPSGERGVSTSKHYTDQLEMFQNSEYHPQFFLATTVDKIQSQADIESDILFKAGGA